MKRNSAALLERIFLDYKAKMFRYMARKAVPSFDRDDVFSEAMLKMACKAEKFDSAKAPVSAWVYFITRWVVADYFRKQKTNRILIESQLPDFYLDECIDIDIDLDVEAERGELERQLARLPERDRRIIVMRLYDDMEYGDIAMAMNLSVANVRKIYQRALKKLRGLIGYEVD